MSNRIRSAELVQSQVEYFKCPLCHSNMEVVALKSLICHNRHTFDFTKQGYLNMLTNPAKVKYSRDLFLSRRKLITESGFFVPLIREITNIISNDFENDQESLAILDAGSGEGSHLANITQRLEERHKGNIASFGIDIAKEGILEAAKNYPKNIWCVADIAKTPFQDEKMDVILNILSPSNYVEFNRLLKKGGTLIKVVPQTNYLKEIRESLFAKTEKENYSNEDVVSRFKEFFTKVETKNIQYQVQLDQPYLDYLIEMTPLTWSFNESQLQKFAEIKSTKITVDVDVLIGKK